MADPDRNRTTHTRETHVEKKSGGTNAFILGGVVVAVLVIAYVLFGMGGDDTATTDAPAGAETESAVEVPEATGTNDAATGTEGDDGAGALGGTDGTEEPALDATGGATEPEGGAVEN